MSQRFNYRQIGILEARIFAYDRYGHSLHVTVVNKRTLTVVRQVRSIRQRLPHRRHHRIPPLETQAIHDHLRQALVFQPTGYRVNIAQSREVDDGVARHPAMEANLVLQALRLFLRIRRVVKTTENRIRLNTQRSERAHAVLRRLRLQLVCRL